MKSRFRPDDAEPRHFHMGQESTAGLSAEQAASALGFHATRDRSPAARLVALEAGEEEPSRSALLKMAKAYRRSLLVFHLSEPPRTGDRGQDFVRFPVRGRLFTDPSSTLRSGTYVAVNGSYESYAKRRIKLQLILSAQLRSMIRLRCWRTGSNSVYSFR